MDYKTVGVDIEAGDAFVGSISDRVKSTHRPEVLGRFGGFNGMMRIPTGYENPVNKVLKIFLYGTSILLLLFSQIRTALL